MRASKRWCVEPLGWLGSSAPLIVRQAWHRSGRYLLSGGYDTRIDLWVIPLLPDHSSGTDHPHTIRRPHFSSSEIHTDYIDQ